MTIFNVFKLDITEKYKVGKQACLSHSAVELYCACCIMHKKNKKFNSLIQNFFCTCGKTIEPIVFNSFDSLF